MAFCSSHAARSSRCVSGRGPGTSTSRPGSSSITRSVSAPKCPTIRAGLRGPIPLINPEPRYRSMPCTVAGSTVVNESTSNCRPYLRVRPPPADQPQALPRLHPQQRPHHGQQVRPERSVATRAIVYPVSSLA